MKYVGLTVIMAALSLAGCGRSDTETAAPSPAAQQVRTDLNQAGQELHQAATTAGQELRPELQKAGQEARQGIHEAANKVSNLTATQP